MPKSESDLFNRLKWLMFSRVVFTFLLLGSTIVVQISGAASPLTFPLRLLYTLIAVLFILSVVYFALLKRVKRQLFLAYLQVTVDILAVSLIIFVTGGFTSIFSFLYLVVIIYSSMLFDKRGIMLVAGMCCVQYGTLVYLEFHQILTPLAATGISTAADYSWRQVLYRVTITMLASLAVGVLSGMLSEQSRKTRKKLARMEERLKRVETMAVIGEMGAGLAHEIKNPLASLSGSIQLLREDLEYNPQHDKLMQIIQREADRLSNLVSDFLLFAKPPVGNQKPIELDKAVREIVMLFEKDSSCTGRIAVHKKMVSNLWIQMDPVHLRQILWNLLLNAAESISGSGRIDIGMTATRNQKIRVQISDTGCGMTPDTVRSIFDPFFTLKPEGTGLGLSIVHSILESYDSWLDVESEVGRGSTFTLMLKRIPPPT